MKTICYKMLDLFFQVELPFDIKISKESVAFIKEDYSSYSERIVFQQVESLPLISEHEKWYEDRYFINTEQGKYVFIRKFIGEQPYGMIAYQQGNRIQVSYLKGAETMFSETRSLLNLLGLEQIFLRNYAMILHASLVRWQGKGILFSAPSGTGKSTQASLWERYMGADILNGDRAGIRKVGDVWNAYGLPYAGSSRIYKEESAPIVAIVVLRQSAENKIWPISIATAVGSLFPEISVHRWDRHFINQILDICLEMLQDIPVYLLECRPDLGAVQLLQKTIERRGDYDTDAC